MGNQKSCCTPSRETATLPGPQHPDATSSQIAVTAEARTQSKRIFIPADTTFIGTDKPLFEIDEEAPFLAT